MFGTSINAGSLPLENSSCSSPVKFICWGRPSLSFCTVTANHYDLQHLLCWVSEYLVSLRCYKKITDQVASTAEIYFSCVWIIGCVRLRHSQSWYMWEHFLVCSWSSSCFVFTWQREREKASFLIKAVITSEGSTFMALLTPKDMNFHIWIWEWHKHSAHSSTTILISCFSLS